MRLLRQVVAMCAVLSFGGTISAGNTYDLSTPEKSWSSVLSALQSGKPDNVKQVTTKKGFASLAESPSSDLISERFTRLGTGWQSWEVRWKERDLKTATARLGPEIKEHGLDFIYTKQGWKLNEWHPGE